MTVAVIAFHGQAASGAHLAYDMGNPNWVSWYPDWQRDYRDARQFSDRLLASNMADRFILIGYSLGGDFIARLTYEWIGDRMVGIVVYESPLKYVDLPRAVDCPVIQIWNDYTPPGWQWWRRNGKAKSIAGWNRQFSDVTPIVANETAHVERNPRGAHWRFRHCYDRALNGYLGGWIQAQKRLAVSG